MNYTRNILTTGTVINTPARFIDLILNEIDLKPDQTILEFGPGKGGISFSVFSKLRDSPPRDYIGFEINEEFSIALREKSKMTVITASAFDYQKHLPQDFSADIIICGLPLSYFPREQTKTFLGSLKELKKPSGKILILYHAPWLKKQISSVFPYYKFRYHISIPPYFLISIN